MEASRNRNRDPYAGSVLFGSTTTMNSPKQGSPVIGTMIGRMSPIPSNGDAAGNLSTPLIASQRFAPSPLGSYSQGLPSGGRSRSAKKPPLASVLDEGIGGGGSSINRRAGLMQQRLSSAAATASASTAGSSSSSSSSSHHNGFARAELVDSPIEAGDPLLQSTECRGRPAYGDTSAGAGAGGAGGSDGFGFRSPDYLASGGSRRLMNSGPGPSGRRGRDCFGGNPAGMALELYPSHSPAQDKLEVAWSLWVMVSGFHPSAFNRDAVLQRFMQFGDIDSYLPCNGNWMFIKYMSPEQAERAAGQNGTYLNSDTLISVMVLNTRIAKQMNLNMSRDGMLLTGEGGMGDNTTGSFVDYEGLTDDVDTDGVRQRRSRAGAEGRMYSSKYRVQTRSLSGSHATGAGAGGGHFGLHESTEEEQELYLKPHRRKNICQRIVEYFFSY